MFGYRGAGGLVCARDGMRDPNVIIVNISKGMGAQRWACDTGGAGWSRSLVVALLILVEVSGVRDCECWFT